MKSRPVIYSMLAVILSVCNTHAAPDEGKARLGELDAYWAAVSRAVREGDFEGYKATCHEKGVLVSGNQKTSYPLSDALARWEKGFMATREGELKASVEFRFSQRFGDKTTAHETGIFLYSTTDAEGQNKQEHIHFQALHVRVKDSWKIMMEYQKSKATREEWDALATK